MPLNSVYHAVNQRIHRHLGEFQGGVMVYLQVENLTKSFGDRLLFEDISFGIDQGQRVAIVARNGTGKTTLLNILIGRESHDSGTITFKRDLRIGFLPQDPEFRNGMSVLEPVSPAKATPCKPSPTTNGC